MTERSSVAMSGTVEMIIKSSLPGEAEKAQITIEGEDQPRARIRIENALTDKNGEEVRLKPGAKVQLTVRSRAAGEGSPIVK